jgi:Tfp pilus assembly protein PilO
VLRRIVIEKRRFVLPILIGLVANVAMYALVVYPLASSVAGGEARAAAATAALKAAERDQASAAATVAGKARAEQELAKFYAEVLPRDLGAANKTMYLQVAQLAGECGLRYTRRAMEEEPVRQSKLAALTMTMTLEGSYADIRRFIYKIETGEPFVVIDNVALGQGREANGPLALTLVLSTFYRVTGDGA